jgi:hypothetical protein
MGEEDALMDVRFDNQFEVVKQKKPFSLGGDSGSRIVDASGVAYGCCCAVARRKRASGVVKRVAARTCFAA